MKAIGGTVKECQNQLTHDQNIPSEERANTRPK